MNVLYYPIYYLHRYIFNSFSIKGSKLSSLISVHIILISAGRRGWQTRHMPRTLHFGGPLKNILRHHANGE